MKHMINLLATTVKIDVHDITMDFYGMPFVLKEREQKHSRERAMDVS